MVAFTMRFPTRQERLRHKMISDWRGVEGEPLNDLPALGMDRLVPEILKSWKLDEKLREDDVAAAWREIVGEFIGKHTAPDGLKRKILTIRISQPAIHHTLMMEKARLLHRLQERFGSEMVKDVKFRHG